MSVSISQIKDLTVLIATESTYLTFVETKNFILPLASMFCFQKTNIDGFNVLFSKKINIDVLANGIQTCSKLTFIFASLWFFYLNGAK